MTSTVFPHGRPLTDDEFLALGETRHRVEMIDGSLLISARGLPRHQFVVRALASLLSAADGHVLTGVNVRLRPGRIVIPDVVVVAAVDFDQPVVEAASVRMIAEVVSPSGSAIDEVWKMHCYAAAGVPGYLLVDQATGAVRSYQLDADHYVEIPGQSRPLGLTVTPASLLPRTVPGTANVGPVP